MKQNKLLFLAGAVMIVAGGLAGCGTGTQTETSAAEAAVPDTTSGADLGMKEQKSTQSGSISMSGSTSMEKVANALCESFMEKYPDVRVTVEFTGSSAGVEAVLSGTCDIGNSSRDLKEEETAAGAVGNVMAIDGIAVAVDPKNTVTDLSRDQLAAIYQGIIKNWSEVGGGDMPVVVIGREAGSGTRSAFEEILKIEDQCAYSNELDSTGAVMAKVASTPGAIGYLSLDAVDSSVSVLKLEGVEASEENIKNKTYFLSRPFIMVTKGAVSEQNELVQAWFDYIQSPEGLEVIKGAGLITAE